MRSSPARILPAFLVAWAFLSPTPHPLSARSADQLYGPLLPLPTPYASQTTRSQPATEGERVAREILRTDRLMGGAEGRLRRSGNEKALSDYKSCRERENEAKAAYTQSLYARANRLTLEARAYLKSALIQAGPPENDPEVVGRALNQTDSALQRGKDIVEAASSSRQRRSLAALEEQQEEARRLYKNGAMRGAYAQTRQVRSGVLDLLRQCANLPVSRDTARLALRRAERVMEQTQKDIGPKVSPRALRLERDAMLQLARARDSFGRNAYRDVLLHSKLVERHLQRAMEARRLATNQSG